MSSSSVEVGAAAVWWLGQGSFVFEGPHSGPVVVDPYLSNSAGAKRLFPVPVAPSDLKVSAIFLTHDHIDHTDPETLVDLVRANPEASIYASPASVAHLARIGITGATVDTLLRDDIVMIPGASVHAVYAKHTEDSVGLVFTFDNGPTIYHTADTEYFEGIEATARFHPDLLTICINGRWGNMTIDEAVKVTAGIAPTEVLPMHWGMFAENTADPQEFLAKLAQANLPTKPVFLEATGLSRHVVHKTHRE